MRRILLSAAMIVFVVAAIVGGTGAFFSDTETSTGNVFAAGALDLKVNSVAHYNGLVCFEGLWHPESTVEWNSDDATLELVVTTTERDDAIEAYNDPAQNSMLNPYILAGSECGGTWSLTDLGPEHKFFDYQDLKPGDHGENTISIHVFDNDAYMCAAIHNVESNENGCTEPELAAEEALYGVGEATCGSPGIGEGELHKELNFLIWEDDGDNILDEDELDKILYQGLAGEGVAGVYPLYTPATNGALPGDSTQYLGVYWCYGDITLNGTEIICDGAGASNLTQTDSLEANFTFYVEQARHNGVFECPSLEDFEGPGEPTEPEVIQAGSGEGWPSADDLLWQAEGRYGNNSLSGDWELGVGNNTQAVGQFSQEQRTWTDGTEYDFEVEYNGGTGIATFTVGGVQTSHNVGAGLEGDLYFIARSPNANGDTTVLSELELNGTPLAPDTTTATNPSPTVTWLVVSSETLAGGFTATGKVQFNYTGTAGSAPAFQLQVRD